MQFIVNRDILLKSLNFVQGVVEKKNTLPILSNVLLQLKDNKLLIVATDLDIVFHDEINDVKIQKEGSTTTSAAILYDILRKISPNSEIKFHLKTENKLSLNSENSDFNLLCLPTDNFPTFKDDFEGDEINLNNNVYMTSMFYNCENFYSDLSKWNTTNITNMKNMFKNLLVVTRILT